MTKIKTYLPGGLPAPVPEADGLSAPYYEGLQREELLIQRCGECGEWQWGPEWICNACNSFNMLWVPIKPRGRIYSWTRCWHPVHPALKEHGPYIALLVELPHANNVRMLGNLVGDPMQQVIIGAEVETVFEHHSDAARPFTLAQWRLVEGG